MDNNFMLKVIAGLDKALSKKMIKSDLKTFDGQLFVKVIAKLDKALSQRAVKQTLKELTNLNVDVNAKLNRSTSEAQLRQQVRELQGKIDDLELRLKANTEQVNGSVEQAAKMAQGVASQNPIEYSVQIKKDKYISDLSLLAKQNSKLFTNTSATQKYGKLLDDAYGASSNADIRELTLRMAAFKSELKATNLSGLTLGDTLKKTVGRAGELISATSMIMVGFSQARKAYTEVKALDDQMTSLYKVADEINSRDDFPVYLDKSIRKAKELSVETKSLISSVTDWKKIGFGLGLSEELAGVATKLEKTGDMSIDKSTKTLISNLQAFKEIDGLTEEQYSERALAIADKINNISNKYSIDAEGISDALQNSVATLQEANNDINQSIAMISAGNKIFQSPSEIGNMLKVVSMRLRGVSEDGEQAEESVAKLQDTILNLTNGKVDIMLDDNTFKSTYDILLEISKVYDTLSDKSQALLLEKIAGKQRGASTAALLQNMAEAEKIYQDSLNSMGSVDKEFERYQESASAAVTRFKETLVDTYTGILSGDMIKGAADTGSAILDLANKFNLLQSSIIGIASVGMVKGIVSIGTACVSTAKQMSMLGDAIGRVNSLPSNTKARKSELISIGEATKELSDKQNKLLLSNRNLQNSDRDKILQGQGVAESKREEKLATMGLTQATDAQTVANVGATTSTFSLKAAITGLGATMKAAFMSNPIGISLMALSVGVGAIVGKYREYRQALEETRQKNIVAADSASAHANKLNELYTQYTKLSGITDRTSSQEQELQKAVEDITVALGDKAKVLEGLTAGTDEYAESLRNATKAEMESQYATAVRGRKSAEENLKDASWSNWDGSQIDIPLNVNMTGIKEHVKALDIVRDELMKYEKETSQGIEWQPADYKDMDSVVEYYHALIDARERLTLQSKTLNDDSILDSDIYKNMDNAISQISDSVETYTKRRYEELKMEYEFHNGIPATVDGFNAMKDAILNSSGAGEGLKRVFNDLLTKDFSSLATQAAQEPSKVSDSKALLPWTEDQNKQIDEYQGKIKSLGESMRSLTDGTMTKSGALDLIQEYGIDPNKVDMSTGAFIGLREELDRISKLNFINVSSVLEEMHNGGFIDDTTFTMLSQIFHDMAYNIEENTKSLSDWKKQLQDSRSSISSITEIIKDLDENGINKLSSSSVDKIISEYPSLLSYLNDEKKLRNGLNQELEQQETSAKTVYANMMQADEAFYQQILQNESNKVLAVNDTLNSIVNGNAQLVNALGGYYDTDLGNFKSLAEAKAKIEETLIKNCASAWAKYYQVQVVNGTATTNALDGGVHGGEEAAARSAAIASTSAYNQTIKSLDDLSNLSIGVADIGGIGSSKFGKSSGSKREFSDEVNYIDRLLSESDKRLKWFNNELEDALTIDEKDSAITKIVNETEYQLKQMNDVYAYYSKAASDKLAQIPEAMRESVKNGAVDIESLNDENLSNLIKEFYALDGQSEDAQDKIRDLDKSIKDMAQQRIQIRIDFLEDENAKLNTRLDKYKAMISAVISGIEGEMDDVNKHYDRQVDKINEQIEALESQQKVYQDQLDELNKQNEALEIQKALEDALYAKRKAENNKNVSIYREGQGFVQEADQDAIKDANDQYDEAQFNKKKYDLQSQIDAFNEQIDGLNEAIDKLEKARDKEIDYLQSIKDAWDDVEKSAERIANMEMADDFFGDGWFSDIMNGDSSYLEDITEKFQTTYSAISDNQQQIDSLNAIKDTMSNVDTATAMNMANMATGYTTLGNTAVTQSNNVNAATGTIPVLTEENRLLNEASMLLWGTSFETFGAQASGVADSIATSYESMASRLEAAAARAVSAIKRIKRAERDDDDDDGYAVGTKNAKPGLRRVAENGPEAITRNDGTVLLATKEQLYPFEGGEKVDTAGETTALLRPINRARLAELTATPPIADRGFTITDEMSRKVLENLSYTPTFDVPKMDYSQFAQRTQEKNVTQQFYGDLSFPNITDGGDAKKLIKELQGLEQAERQYHSRR